MSAHDSDRASIALEDPVTMCHTWENTYWCHGWVDKAKFRGSLLSRASKRDLLGEEEVDTVIRGKVRHGWVVTVIGDTSGCGWDMTTFFRTQEPRVLDDDGTRRLDDLDAMFDYDEDGEDLDEPVMAEIADGPHKATWWEP